MGSLNPASLRQTSLMNLLAATSSLLLLAACRADKTAGHVNNNVQVPAASSTAGISPYYSEYDYNLYEPQAQTFNSLDRQASIEAVLGAPVAITAFAAALFGGILSPLISEGLSRMSEYQIEWPSFNQRVEKRRKTKTKAGSKARDLDNSVNWLEMLETVNNVVSAIRTKRSVSESNQPTVDQLSY